MIPVELAQERDQALQQSEDERQRVDRRLAAPLRGLGVGPEDV